MPETLIPSAETNERGFWESELVKATNDKLFERLGVGWRSLRPIPEGGLEAVSNDELAALSAVIESEFREADTPVLKDPRLCRLLPVWRPTFERVARRTVYPIIVRNPVETAQSLMARDSIDREQALLLWARYYLDAELNTRGNPRCFITYDDLLSDWRRTLARMVEALDLPIEVSPEKAVAIDEFLSADLKHNRHSLEEVEEELVALPLVAESFAALSRCSGSGGEPVDTALLDEARHELDRSGVFLDEVLERARVEKKRRLLLKSETEATSADLHRTRRALEDVTGVQHALKGLSEEVRQRLGKLIYERDEARLAEAAVRHERDAARARIGDLKEARDEAKSRAADLKAERDAARARFGELKQAREEARQAAADFKQDRDAARARIGELKNARDEARQSLEDARSRVEAARTAQRLAEREMQLRDQNLAERGKELKQVRVQLKTVTAKYRSTQEILGRERTQIKELKRALSQAELLIESYRRSLLWRAYMRAADLLRSARSRGGRLLGNSTRRRRSRAIALVQNSNYFNGEWYLERYPDVARSGVDPATHFYDSGWREGRDPGPDFSTSAYLKTNADVAALGINPLVHYIEYGHSEGRGEPQQARLKEQNRPSFGPFPSPALVREGGPTSSATAQWRRSSRLSLLGSAEVTLAGYGVASVADERQRTDLLRAVDLLEAVSSGAQIGPEPVADRGASAAFLDGWHAGAGLIRTRWNGSGAGYVVRAFQHIGGALRFIGEGFSRGATDLIDIRPFNSFFPILFVFTDKDGLLDGWDVLMFPSLLRGGSHDLEAAYVAERSGESAAQLSRRLAVELLRQGEESPLVDRVEVDLASADGTTGIFKSDFKNWLSTVIGASLTPLPGAEAAASWVTQASQAQGKRKRGRGKSALQLPAEMIPSLSILTAVAPSGDEGSAATLPFIAPVGSGDAARLALPSGFEPAPSLSRSAPTIDWWPVSSEGDIAVAAIRSAPRQPLTDAQLLIPFSAALPLGDGHAQAVSWIIVPGRWNEQSLLESLEALALQQHVGPSTIMFVGEVPPEVDALARRLFSERTSTFADLDQLVAALETPLVAYLGSNVLLHDCRTSALMSEMLASNVATASVPPLSLKKHGNQWQVVADQFADLFGLEKLSGRGLEGAHLVWRSSWPVAAPHRDLWMATTSTLRSWHTERRAQLSPDVRHVSSVLVTASYNGPVDDGLPPLSLPSAAAGQRLDCELVVS